MDVVMVNMMTRGHNVNCFDTLTARLGNQDHNYWIDTGGGKSNEAITMILTNPAGGGVLCCINQPTSMPSINPTIDNPNS